MSWRCKCEALTVDVVRLDQYQELEKRLAECESELQHVYDQLKKNTEEAHQGMDSLPKNFLFPWSKKMSLYDVISTVKEMATAVTTEGINPKYFEKWRDNGK